MDREQRLKEKTIIYDDVLYYPFDDNHVWKYDEIRDKWYVITMPEFLCYLPGKDKLMPVTECICKAKDLFNYGCRC